MADKSHALTRRSVLEHRLFLHVLLLQRPALGADVRRTRVSDLPGRNPLIWERGCSALPLTEISLEVQPGSRSMGERHPSRAAGAPRFTPGFFQPSFSSCSIFPGSSQTDNLCLSRLLFISPGFSVFSKSGLGADSSLVQAASSLGRLLRHLQSSCRYPQQTLLGPPSPET